MKNDLIFCSHHRSLLHSNPYVFNVTWILCRHIMSNSLKFHEKSTYFVAFHILPLFWFLTPYVTCNSLSLLLSYTRNTHTYVHGSLCVLPGNFPSHTAKHHSTQRRMHIKMAALYLQYQSGTRMVETVMIYHVLFPLPRCTAPPPHPFHFLSASTTSNNNNADNIHNDCPSFMSAEFPLFFILFWPTTRFFSSIPLSH